MYMEGVRLELQFSGRIADLLPRFEASISHCRAVSLRRSVHRSKWQHFNKTHLKEIRLRESVLDSPGSGAGSVIGYCKDKNKPSFVYNQNIYIFGVVYLPSVFQK